MVGRLKLKLKLKLQFEQKKNEFNAFEKNRNLRLRENCVEKLLNKRSCAYLGRISLTCFAECPHHAGSTIEAGAADEV